MIESSGDSVDSQGKSDFWNCIYYSPALDSLHQIVVWGQVPVFDSPRNPGPGQDTSTIAQGWLDSDVTIAVAENSGGSDYRINNQDVFVNASLRRWFFGNDPSLTVWQFFYSSSNAPPLDFVVDALTGTIVTGISEGGFEILPEDIELHQNYPKSF